MMSRPSARSQRCSSSEVRQRGRPLSWFLALTDRHCRRQRCLNIAPDPVMISPQGRVSLVTEAHSLHSALSALEIRTLRAGSTSLARPFWAGGNDHMHGSPLMVDACTVTKMPSCRHRSRLRREEELREMSCHLRGGYRPHWVGYWWGNSRHRQAGWTKFGIFTQQQTMRYHILDAHVPHVLRHYLPPLAISRYVCWISDSS